MNLLLIKAIVVLGLVSALVFGYFAWEKNIRSDERSKVVAEYNIEAAKQNTANRVKEQALQVTKDQQENTDAVNEKTITLLADKLHATRMLIDPKAPVCDCSAVTSTPSGGAANPPQVSGVLSAELTELLLSQAREADAINNAYISCRADAYNIRKPQ